jgi:phage gp46-like protein
MPDLLLQITDDYKVDFVYDETALTFKLTESLADVVRNNIIMSIMINKGELIDSPLLGSRRNEIKSGGINGARELEYYDREALQWIIDIGRAISIDIKTWPEPVQPERLNETIAATLPDGEIVPFNTFYRVG